MGLAFGLTGSDSEAAKHSTEIVVNSFGDIVVYRDGGIVSRDKLDLKKSTGMMGFNENGNPEETLELWSESYPFVFRMKRTCYADMGVPTGLEKYPILRERGY